VHARGARGSRGGLRAARHLRADIYEVDAGGKDVTYRVIFAADGRYNQVLLALHLLNKKTRRTPPPSAVA
jgi:phage-related protein